MFPPGKVTKKTAEWFAANIDSLPHKRWCNLPLSRDVSNWLVGLDNDLYELLAERGLVEPRQQTKTLEGFVSDYIASRHDVTERRRGKMDVAKRRLVKYFSDVELQTITSGSAFEYSRHLLKKLAPAAAQKECQLVSQFFRHALRKKLIPRNPFEGVTVGQATNNERQAFIDRETIQKVIDVWPKPFQNLRSSRQTELEQQFPTYMVCSWLGNTPHGAHKHYLTVTDEHYAEAVEDSAILGDKRGKNSPESGRIEAHEKTRVPVIIPENASFSDVVGILENAAKINQIAVRGLEPPRE